MQLSPRHTDLSPIPAIDVLMQAMVAKVRSGETWTRVMRVPQPQPQRRTTGKHPVTAEVAGSPRAQDPADGGDEVVEAGGGRGFV